MTSTFYFHYLLLSRNVIVVLQLNYLELIIFHEVIVTLYPFAWFLVLNISTRILVLQKIKQIKYCKPVTPTNLIKTVSKSLIFNADAESIFPGVCSLWSFIHQILKEQQYWVLFYALFTKYKSSLISENVFCLSFAGLCTKLELYALSEIPWHLLSYLLCFKYLINSWGPTDFHDVGLTTHPLEMLGYF